MNTWSVLEHRVYRLLRRKNWVGSKFVVLVSGGADSVCVLSVLRSLQKALKFELSVVHFHHGKFENRRFRDRSQKLVQKICRDWGLPLKIFENLDPGLRSEADLRRFRGQCLRDLSIEKTYFVSGHHRDDLVETRLLRLIRGTGGRGLVSMKVQQGPKLRPLLTSARNEIEKDLKRKKIFFLRDPSQKDLRSWLRHFWLPSLEKRQKSGVLCLGRSLEVIAGSIEKQRKIPDFEGDFLPRNLFLQQSVELQSEILAQFFVRRGASILSHGIVQECLRRLDKNQIEHTFILAGLQWRIDAKNIRAEVLSK